jgi:D-glycero-D-manno-heptose 1,7-bisphosphate phosphatase
MIPPVYSRVYREPYWRSVRPAVFLDRDGVLVEDVGYLHRAEDIQYISRALRSVAALNAAGVPVIVVTNQAGVGRGLYGWDSFEDVQKVIAEDLAREGGWIDAIWACAPHPEGVGELAAADHAFRKPNPGMILAAVERLQLDRDRSWMIGDKPLDIEAAFRGRIAGACHVATGYGAATRRECARIPEEYPNVPCELAFSVSIADATSLIAERIQQR